MPYNALADLVLVLHFGFILFVVLGGLLVLRWRWCLWIHVPAVFWAALLEFQGWFCPLTPLETRLREAGGASGYATGFIDHYLAPVIYPAGLSRETQIALGALVVILNLGIYAGIWSRHRRLAT